MSASSLPASSVVSVPEGLRPLHPQRSRTRSEEHTSELQSRLHLVCRLLLENNNPENHHCTRTLTRQPIVCACLPSPVQPLIDSRRLVNQRLVHTFGIRVRIHRRVCGPTDSD